MPSNHLVFQCPLLLLPSVFPFIRVFSFEPALHITWPKDWSFSFSISPSNEYSGLISFRIDWLDLLAVQRPFKNLLKLHNLKALILWHSAFFTVQFSHPWAFLVGQRVKNPPEMQETCVQTLIRKIPLEKGKATHSSMHAWKIPRTEEPGGLQAMGSQRVGHDWLTFTSRLTSSELLEKPQLWLYRTLLAKWYLCFLICCLCLSQLFFQGARGFFCLFVCFVFNLMAVVTIHSDFGAQENKICHFFHFFPIYLPWDDGTRCHDLPFLNVEF